MFDTSALSCRQMWTAVHMQLANVLKLLEKSAFTVSIEMAKSEGKLLLTRKSILR